MINNYSCYYDEESKEFVATGINIIQLIYKYLITTAPSNISFEEYLEELKEFADSKSAYGHHPKIVVDYIRDHSYNELIDSFIDNAQVDINIEIATILNDLDNKNYKMYQNDTQQLEDDASETPLTEPLPVPRVALHSKEEAEEDGLDINDIEDVWKPHKRSGIPVVIDADQFGTTYANLPDEWLEVLKNLIMKGNVSSNPMTDLIKELENLPNIPAKKGKKPKN